MNNGKLSSALRDKAMRMNEEADMDAPNYQDVVDAAELINVLARIVEGKPLQHAFGAPGDWGYNTPIGAALAER